jgi:hypothetical protein
VATAIQSSLGMHTCQIEYTEVGRG